MIIKLIFCLLFCSAAFANGLPDLGDSSMHSISRKDMRKLQRGFLKQLKASTRFIQDAVAQDYIQSLGHRLVSHSSGGKMHFKFFIIQSPEINAFAGPAGYVGIYSGLFLMARHESELAAVVAHEISHVTQRHLLRSIEKQKKMRGPMLAGALAAIALGVVNPALGEGALLAGMGGLQQTFVNYTRSNEKEADRIGIQLLYAADFDPHSMAGFFRRMHQATRYDAIHMPALLRTHPVSSERIADAENRVTQLPRKRYRHDEAFALVRERIRVDASGNLPKLLKAYLKQIKATPSNQALRYGYAFGLYKHNDYAKSLRALKPLIRQAEDNPLYQMLRANIYREQRKYSQALRILNEFHELYPENKPLIYQFGLTLLEAKQASRAVDLFRQQTYKHPHDIAFYLILARAYSQAGNKGEAYFTRAIAMQKAEAYKQAIQQMKTAKYYAKKDFYLRQKIKAKLKELNEQLDTKHS